MKDERVKMRVEVIDSNGHVLWSREVDLEEVQSLKVPKLPGAVGWRIDTTGVHGGGGGSE